MRRPALACALAIGAASCSPEVPGPAQTGRPQSAVLAPAVEPAVDEAALLAQARRIAALIGPDPVWPADLFHDDFRRNVPDADFRRLLSDTFAAEGAVDSVRLVRRDREGGRLEFLCTKGGAVICDLRLATAPGNPVRYFRTWGSVPGWTSLEAASAAFAELPGEAGLDVCELRDGRCRRLVSHRPDVRLNVASAFKLNVLAALAEDVRDGRAAWSEIVRLDRGLRSLPTGILQRWPAGAPVTLHTLATLMIERSDNTATDHLIDRLGRDRIEAVAERGGDGADPRNTPLLSTAELFRLKYADGGRLADPWNRAGPAERRRMLAEDVRPIPEDRIDSPTAGRPLLVDSIGWFASASGLCRTLASIGEAASPDGMPEVLRILAVEPGTTSPPDVFPVQGFKGGRLPGIASRAWLVRSESGRLFAVAGIWNRTDADVDEARFVRMLTRVLELLHRDAG